MNVGLDLTDIGASPVIKYIDVTTIQNGTFTTKDEVAPVITLNTPTSVSSTFNIAGTIYDVGGMGTARATLRNGTHTVVQDLGPVQAGSTYTFDCQVNWPVEDGVTLTIDATDAAGNVATPVSQVINVVNVGFSNPAPTGYINATPAQAQAFMSQINTTKPVAMYLGSATYGPTLLVLDTSSDYAKGALPVGLGDGEYWVNVSGTDTFGTGRYLNWTFTLDTTAPVINTFTVADSDGDGYIEAGETLTLNWDVAAADPNFDHVALVDISTGEELWSSNSLSGTDTKVILDGNRDLAFRAYDYAGNYASRGFHLYYDYMIWVNSTKMGEFAGIDTTYTATKDITRTAVSSITLYGCTVTFPTLNQLERTVTNVGQVTSDTYVTVDVNANRTLTGSETYQNAWVLDPNTDLDFRVEVPHAPKATLVLAEANESYIADLISGGSGGMHSVNYTELIRKTAYIFIDGGWTKVVVADDGTISMPDHNGTPITNAGNISATLRHPDNQVDLNTGYRLSTQGLRAITPASGDYALAAIAMDGDRMGLLGVMPIMVMESGDLGSISNTTVVQGGTFTAQFTTPCEHLGVVLLRNVTYDGTAVIDAAKLDKESLHLNLTYNGVPATQKLIGNIYVSPSSGKYVVANTSQATVSTSGLEAGTYQVYMVGQSASGTMQAYGEHMLTITPGGSIAVTSVPTGAAIYLDGTDMGVVTNGTLTAVPAGTHNVTVTLAGYGSVSSSVTVVAGQTATVHFDLTPVGSIDVTSVPAGAAIYLDGTDTGVVTNGTLAAVPVGDHNVTVTLAGYNSASANVTVVANQTATVHFDMVPGTGNIAVTSIPAGAVIYLNGTNTGVVTNGTLTGIPVGNHTVMVTLAGYNSASSQVTVVSNQTTEVHFALTRTHSGGGSSGGGSSSGSTTSTFTSTGTLLTGSSGTVLKSVLVNADDNVGSLFVPIGVTALDADGNRLSDVTINPLTGDEVPEVPSGSIFKFAGYAYEVTPAGATFSPGITLTFTIPDDIWETLDPTNNQFLVTWYNQETGLWEELQATVNSGSRTVTATVTHFSTYALFTEPATTPVTPTETATTVPTTTTTTTPAGEPPAEGLPMTMIIFAIVIIAIIAAAGYYFFVMKK